jgi:2-polyprenyl-3-methyl-5-hydroxy-6-metoxy-1,4-benzoquinol methylase
VKQVHAIDTSVRMIQLAKQRARERGVTNVRFEQKTLFDESLGTGTYDVVVAFNILHLLDDARVAVDRTAKLLKPGGLLVSSTPCLGEAGRLSRVLVLVMGKLILSHLRVFRVDQVRDLIRDGGFRILKSSTRGDSIPLYFAVARK